MTDHHHHQHNHQEQADWAGMAELLDLDAEVLHAYRSEVFDWIDELAGDPPPRRILDVGSGTGTGALALARRYERAEVTALDLSEPLLARINQKAAALGVADRMHTVQADLDATWPTLDPVDLVWAANSLHHMADPDRVLADIFATIRPGGLLALAEIDSFPRFLTDDAGRELEERAHAAAADERAHLMPHLGSDWGPPLAKAGFVVAVARDIQIDLTAPLPAAAGRFAQATLQRLRSSVPDRISADDLAALDALIHGLPSRDDLHIRATRSIWLARRP
jgi:ubiquinone/menaquinone biosynthesis C-methylase UbiE